MLSVSLADSHRDPSLCAAATLIVEAVEMLVLGPGESGMQVRVTNSARSLIKGYQWNTRTQGLGGVLSWLSILMELVDCVSFRQTIAWDPDTWGIDVSFPVHNSIAGNEELWTHQIIHVCAKVSDLRASQPESSGCTAKKRIEKWNLYNEWCNKWFASIPRSMLPLGNVQPWQRNPQSVFPQVWLLEKSAVISQMLFHLTRIMLIETDPLRETRFELEEEQQRHAYTICGIFSNDKNSGIPIFSVQVFGLAAAYLLDKKAQEEASATLHQVRLTTGLNTAHIREKLEETWGWHSPHQTSSSTFDTVMPIEFQESESAAGYHDAGITEALSHPLADPESLLHQDFHYNYP